MATPTFSSRSATSDFAHVHRACRVRNFTSDCITSSVRCMARILLRPQHVTFWHQDTQRVSLSNIPEPRCPPMISCCAWAQLSLCCVMTRYCSVSRFTPRWLDRAGIHVSSMPSGRSCEDVVSVVYLGHGRMWWIYKIDEPKQTGNPGRGKHGTYTVCTDVWSSRYYQVPCMVHTRRLIMYCIGMAEEALQIGNEPGCLRVLPLPYHCVLLGWESY